jgi:serine/threonine protein kinase
MANAATCPTCGLEVPSDTQFCPRDGTELVDAVAREATVKRDALAGAKLGDYVIKQRIGAGGMGIVYEGVQPIIGKPVAIKVLRTEFAEDPVQVQRLLAEARAVNAIRHRGIIDIFGFGELPDGRQYIVMEYLSGQPLDAVILERGSLPAMEALPILEEVLAALGAAHGAGVIHRDMKPSNIFIVNQPDGTHYVKLLDFGLAKNTIGGGGNTRVTQVVGTPEYMAPEQARGERLGPWTDLYALGVVAFELLTGQIPFDGTGAIEVAMKHIEQPPPLPSSLDRSIPQEMDRLILRLMAKVPEERPASAEVVRMEIKRIHRLLLSAATRIHEAVSPAKAAPPAPTVLSPSPVMRSAVLAEPVRVFGSNGARITGYAETVLGHEVDATTISPPPNEISAAPTTDGARAAKLARDTDETRAVEPGPAQMQRTKQVHAQMRRWSATQWLTLGVFLIAAAGGLGVLWRSLRGGGLSPSGTAVASPAAGKDIDPPLLSPSPPEPRGDELPRPVADVPRPDPEPAPVLSAEHLTRSEKHGPVARPEHKRGPPAPSGPSATAVAIKHESPGRPTPTAQELTQRINKLWRRLKEADPEMQENEPAFVLLKQYKGQVSPAMSEQQREDLAAYLDDWQATYHPR